MQLPARPRLPLLARPPMQLPAGPRLQLLAKPLTQMPAGPRQQSQQLRLAGRRAPDGTWQRPRPQAGGPPAVLKGRHGKLGQRHPSATPTLTLAALEERGPASWPAKILARQAAASGPAARPTNLAADTPAAPACAAAAAAARAAWLPDANSPPGKIRCCGLVSTKRLARRQLTPAEIKFKSRNC